MQASDEGRMLSATRAYPLTHEQRAQLEYQVQAQVRSAIIRTTVDVAGDGLTLRDYAVYPGVLRPDVTDSMHVARYLFYNNRRLYTDGTVLDMGCGSGIFGIVAALSGARRVVLADIAERCVENARENAQRFGLGEGTTALHSDLFDRVDDRFDLIVFSHPYFSAPDAISEPLLSSMLAPPSQYVRFLSAARSHLSRTGRIVTCYFDIAGSDNDPAVQAPKYGYSVQTAFALQGDLGATVGTFYIHELLPLL